MTPLTTPPARVASQMRDTRRMSDRNADGLPATPAASARGTSAPCENDEIGPNGLTIRTPDGTVAEPERWLPLVHRTLLSAGGFLVVDSGPPNTYAQALNHEGSLILEYRDGSRERHFQAREVTLEEIATALSQWARGEREFVGRHDWHRLAL